MVTIMTAALVVVILALFPGQDHQCDQRRYRPGDGHDGRVAARDALLGRVRSLVSGNGRDSGCRGRRIRDDLCPTGPWTELFRYRTT